MRRRRSSDASGRPRAGDRLTPGPSPKGRREPQPDFRWNSCYFLIRRVFWSLLVLFGLSIVIFVIARVMPGDPARMALGPRASQEQVADLQGQAWGSTGRSSSNTSSSSPALRTAISACRLLTKRPVNDDIAETFAATFELVLATIVIAFVCRRAARRAGGALNKDRWADNLVRFVAILGAVTPSFLLALLLQILAGYVLHALPTTGRLSPDIAVHRRHHRPCCDRLAAARAIPTWLLDALRHLLLPATRARRRDRSGRSRASPAPR